MGDEQNQSRAGNRPGDMPLLPPSGAEAPRRANNKQAPVAPVEQSPSPPPPQTTPTKSPTQQQTARPASQWPSLKKSSRPTSQPSLRNGDNLQGGLKIVLVGVAFAIGLFAFVSVIGRSDAEVVAIAFDGRSPAAIARDAARDVDEVVAAADPVGATESAAPVRLPVNVERARDQAITFDTQAEITFASDESSEWSIVLSSPEAVAGSARDLQRVDVVIRYETRATPAGQLPLDPAFEGRFGYGYGNISQVLTLSERSADSCTEENTVIGLPSLIFLALDTEIRGSLCLPPAPTNLGAEASNVLFVHLRTTGNDIVWTTGLPAAPVEFDR